MWRLTIKYIKKLWNHNNRNTSRKNQSQYQHQQQEESIIYLRLVALRRSVTSTTSVGCCTRALQQLFRQFKVEINQINNEFNHISPKSTAGKIITTVSIPKGRENILSFYDLELEADSKTLLVMHVITHLHHNKQ